MRDEFWRLRFKGSRFWRGVVKEDEEEEKGGMIFSFFSNNPTKNL